MASWHHLRIKPRTSFASGETLCLRKPVTSTKMPFGSEVIFDRMSITGTIISITAGGTRARLPAPLRGTHSVECDHCALRSRPAVAHHPKESPHTTETEPEVCFIDTETPNIAYTHTVGNNFPLPLC